DAITVGVADVRSAITVNAGGGNDTVRLDKNVLFSTISPGRSPVVINGQAGTDTLDYSGYFTNVRVNLAQGTGTDLAGITGVENVTGGTGNDILIGDAANN